MSSPAHHPATTSGATPTPPVLSPSMFSPEMISSMAKSGSDSSAAAAAVDKEKLRELLSQIFNYVTKQCDENEDKVQRKAVNTRSAKVGNSGARH